MKTFSTLLALAATLLTTTTRAGAQTVVARRSYPITGLSFPSPTIGYAAGADSVLKTTDGGLTWRTLPFSAGNDIRAIRFLDEEHGWITGDSMMLYKTDDGGGHWHRHDPGVLSYFKDIYFLNSSTGFLVGTQGAMLKTEDGGMSWSPLRAADTRDIGAITFATPQVGYIGGLSLLYKTTDGGASWQYIDSSNSFLWSLDLVALSPDTLFSRNVGFASYINRSYDGGAHWVDDGFLYNVMIDFTSDGKGYGAGQDMMFRSTDRGITWDTLPQSLGTLNSEGFTIVGDTVGFAFGSWFGTGDMEWRIMRISLPGESSGVEREDAGRAADVRVTAGPDRRTIALMFGSAIDHPTTVTVSDILGRVLLRRALSPRSAGTIETLLLPESGAGVRLVEIAGRDFRVVRKIVLP